MLTGLLAAGSASAQTDNADGSTTLLNGTLTVASREGGNFLGYNRQVSPHTGSLSVSPAFTVDGHTDTLDRLEVNLEVTLDQLEFWLKGSGWFATGAGGHAERKRWVLYWEN